MCVVLFDLDDTLFDHQYCSRAGLAAVHSEFADRMSGAFREVEVTYRELLEHWHDKVLRGVISIDESRIERFRMLLSSDDDRASDDEVRAAARCYRDAYDSAFRPVPGAIELLKRVKRHRRIGIVTNHVLSEQIQKISMIGVAPYVDELVVSEEVGVAKPDPKIFEVALSRLGGQADQTVMVGDSWSSDIQGAIQMGIRAIWLNRYGATCPDAELASEVHALEPVDELEQLILDPT